MVEILFLIYNLLLHLLVLHASVPHSDADRVLDGLELQALRSVHQGCEHGALATSGHAKCRDEVLEALLWKGLIHLLKHFHQVLQGAHLGLHRALIEADLVLLNTT